MSRRRLFLWLGAAALLLFTGTAAHGGSTPFSVEAMKGLLILEHGRVKPLETYSNNLLLQFSGKRSFHGEPALSWMAKLLFDPAKTGTDAVFLINHPDIPRAIGLEPAPERRHRYSFSELEKGYPKLRELALSSSSIEPKERTIVENELIRVHENLVLYMNLSASLRFTERNRDFSIPRADIRQLMGLPDGRLEFSFLELALNAHRLRKVSDSLLNKSPEQWSDFEREAFRLMGALYQWSLQYRDLPFKILPPMKPGREDWTSPWDAIASDFYRPEVRNDLVQLARMRFGYLNGQNEEFADASRQLTSSVRGRSLRFRGARFSPVELLYNRVNPFSWARILYAAALLFLLSGLGLSREKRYALASVSAGAALLLHTFGLACRITILGRPPVSNLYETFIFVSWIAALLGLLLEATHRKGLGIAVASAAGVLLMTISGKFGAEGDTMRMLVAVLNSNFWLSTHVVAITTGYAGCCVAGILGHIYLIQAIFKPREKAPLEKTHKMMLASLMFGLLFSALGTALGGIWADQSWGRFWGWDPKENGALMIVLWCGIILHSRLAGLIRQVGTAAACVFGGIVVMWAWFGINLLGVGLHSYGFTSGIAASCGIYAGIELLFLLAAVPAAQKTLAR